MKNKYEIRGEVTAIFINSRNYGVMETIISTNKLQRANEYLRTWTTAYHKRSKRFYVSGNVTLANGKKTAVFLHRWITDAPELMVVDHENHDTLNNTDDNLRVLTKGQNGQNRNGANRDSTSGHIGVSYVKSSNKWMASCAKKHLGFYKTFEEAARVVDSYRAIFMPYSKEARNNGEFLELVLLKPRKKSEKQCDIKGISWSDIKKRWAVKLRLNGKTKHIGYSKELVDAISKLEEAKKENKIS